MKIQTFKDGQRFIVVFEGISTKEEDMIRGFLAPALEDVTRPAQVEPIEVEQEVSPEIPVVFSDGEYFGQMPGDILRAPQKEALAAYRYICDGLTKKAFDNNDLSKACESAIKEYLNSRFENCDGAEYAAKLTEKQVEKFYETFGYNIPTDLNTGKVEQIPAIIESFKM